MGEGQDEGKKEEDFLLDSLTLASSDYAKDKLSQMGEGIFGVKKSVGSWGTNP